MKEPTEAQTKRKQRWDKAIAKFLFNKAGYSETIWEVIHDTRAD